MRIAITRDVSSAIANCELTFIQREPIDPLRARAQHDLYESCLASLGWQVHRLPADPGLPDCVFIEDTAVVLDELAILARPGPPSRRGELPAVEEALRALRPLARIESPATLDGGDVLPIGKRIFVGLSQRTNRQALEQMRTLTSPFGFDVVAVPVHGCLHLKSAVTAVGPDAMLINRSFVDSDLFAGWDLIEVDPTEPMAANALLLDEVVLVDQDFPRTRRRLESAGIHTREVDLSELRKAEGGLTCGVLLLGSGLKF